MESKVYIRSYISYFIATLIICSLVEEIYFNSFHTKAVELV